MLHPSETRSAGRSVPAAAPPAPGEEAGAASRPAITAREHGGPREALLERLGIAPGELLDLSVNVNPYGPCLAMREAVRAAPLERYPDPAAHRARAALAAWLGVGPHEVALGNGAAELLWTIARSLLAPGDGALIVEPTFCEFRAACAAVGARLLEWRTGPERQFAVDLDAVAQAGRAGAARVVYLCVPGSPTGSAVAAADIAAWAAAQPQLAVVLDQSFLSLSERFADAAVAMPDNVVRVRSLTKDHAIPGVRVGYLIGTPALVAGLEAQRPAWTTSAAAQAAALVACEQEGFVARSRHRILADRAWLTCALERSLADRGVAITPSSTGFFLLRTGASADLQARLLARHHILVRDCRSFGLPDHLRIAAPPRPAARRFLAALGQELGRC
jgi:histidinol-phosphate/aromatic aminotransferase/cobyric acid decarboxylase-like protein